MNPVAIIISISIVVAIIYGISLLPEPTRGSHCVNVELSLLAYNKSFSDGGLSITQFAKAVKELNFSTCDLMPRAERITK